MTTPEHAKDRAKRAYENVDEMAKHACENCNRSHVDFLIHDIRNDIRMLAEQAERWQDYCRKTGQNPFRYYEG